VVIPSWNGLHLLRRNLPSVLEAVRFYTARTGAAVEVLVVDDGSDDDTVNVLPEEFPSVQLVARKENSGFAIACNSGFKRCRYPLVALLNNDVRIQRDYLVHKAPHFRDDRVFAVTAKVFEEDPAVFATGGKCGRFRRGFWSAYFNYDLDEEASERSNRREDQRFLSFYAVGGFATYDREKLAQVGGFLPILSPFHWEDIDLSYRGWKRGWEVLYEPQSVGHHQISATIDAHFSMGRVEASSLRNRLLFHWINLHSPGFLGSHLLMLALLAVSRFFVADWVFYRGLLLALRSLPEVFPLRKLEKKEALRSDSDLARILSEFYFSAPIRVYYSREQVLREHPDRPPGQPTNRSLRG
jgi:GT2 family glycosyltransferase